MSIAYDGIASAYARHRGIQEFVVEILERLYRESAGEPVLEVGCGTGAYITEMTDSVARTGFGLDPSIGMLHESPTCARTTYVQGHAACLPFADRSVGMIFSVNVVHHLDDPGAYFREAARALAPGGVLCTATDSPAIIARRKPLSRYWPATVPLELERYHDLGRLREHMAAAAFHDIDEFEGHSEFPITDIGPYRDRTYSCLRMISEDDFIRGLRAMEFDLRSGPVEGNSELAFLWGRRR